jgi:transcriptional regulator with XRE-family HTH domain
MKKQNKKITSVKNPNQEVTFGKLLQNIRKDRGLTQPEFGKILKITRAQVAFLEMGRKAASAKNAYEFAKRLGVPETSFVEKVFLDQINKGKLSFRVKVSSK